MDEVDRKLLSLLQADATVGMSRLAEQVGLSPTPVWKRIQKLEQAGVITAPGRADRSGAHWHRPDRVRGDRGAASTRRSGCPPFAAALDAMPEVMDAYRMAGEVDYMLRVAVPDMAEFDAFYKRLIAAVPLKNVTSRFAMERLKQTTSYPLPSRAFRDRRGAEAEE